MALGIPLPSADFGGQLASGSQNLMNQMIMQHLQNKKMAQEQAQFEQELAIKKQAAGRAGANSDLTRSIMQQQLLGLQHKNDPNYEFNQFKALQNMVMGGEQPNQDVMPNQNMPQNQMPNQEMGEGMGMFSQEGMTNAQQPQMPQPNMGQNNQNNFESLKQNPMLRGFFKHKFGFDPLAEAPQTPQEKQVDALNLFKQKEALKNTNKGGNTPTNTVLTQNQQSVQGIDTVLPMLDDLISSKNIPGIMNFNPNENASYKAKTSSMIDTLVAAQQLPKVQASIDLVEEQIRRKSGESVDNYKSRLKDLKKDLISRRKRSKLVVDTRKINTEDTVHLIGPNGENYDVPSSEVDQILKENTGVRRG